MTRDIDKRFGPRPEGIPPHVLAENEEVQQLIRKAFQEFAEKIEPLIPEGEQKIVGINQLQASMQWMLSALESELKEY